MAMFYPQEKVFSLKRTAQAVPRGNLTQLFEEFFCYLVVTALYLEGRGTQGAQISIPQISDPHFGFDWDTCYNEMIGRKLAKGLQDRYAALHGHPDLHPQELPLLVMLNGLFTGERGWYHQLSGKAFLNVALARGFSADMVIVARYAGAMFGQRDFASPTKAPKLYLSAFGNIHLGTEQARDCESHDLTTMLGTPALLYGSRGPQGDTVTGLWSLISAQLETLCDPDQAMYQRDAGDLLGDMLASLTFLGGRPTGGMISAPRYAAMLYLRKVVGLDKSQPAEIAVAFYKDFFFGDCGVTSVIRRSLLGCVLDLMTDATGRDGQYTLFSNGSYYQRLTQERFAEPFKAKRSPFLDFAIEALDAKVAETPGDDDTQDDPTAGDAEDDQADTSALPDADPQTEDGGYDPSTPPPASPIAAVPAPENTMGLLTFDKTGEGINEDLYRSAVVALNDRLRHDSSATISAKTKAALNDWVTNYLYRTAIAATQSQIALLNLKSYFKTVSTQG